MGIYIVRESIFPCLKSTLQGCLMDKEKKLTRQVLQIQTSTYTKLTQVMKRANKYQKYTKWNLISFSSYLLDTALERESKIIDKQELTARTNTPVRTRTKSKNEGVNTEN